MTGMVYLVGVGPGDPELLTLRAAGLLSRADVVLYDALVDERVLDRCGRQAERVFVGKRAGRPHKTQEEINALLVEYARAGKAVVRLKGGDPFIFGRGGEEALALAESGIPFEVVPGVTAAVAAGAYAGIPLTHRGLASACVFVTGHEDPTKPESDLDWPALAALPGTLAVYMGLARLREIAQELIRGGRPADTPAAVVASGTTAEQRTVVATLETIARQTEAAGLQAPAVLLVGPVVLLREKLAWFERRPLFGKRVLVTRPAREAGEMLESLAGLGARPVLFPTVAVEPVADLRILDEALGRLGSFDWTVFSSANAVSIFFDRLEELGLDARTFGTCRVAVMGSAGARALAERAIRADLVPEQFVAEALLDALRSTGELAGKRFLLPRSDIGRDLLRDGLRSAGAAVTDVVIYRTSCPKPDPEAVRRLLETPPDCLTFTSSSTATNFASMLGADAARSLARNAVVAAIGPVTASTLRELGLAVQVEPHEHTVAALVAALVEYFASGQDRA